MEQNTFGENQNKQNQFAGRGQKSPVGPVVGTVIIIALLAFGALYFWGERLNRGGDSAPYILDDKHAATPQEEGWMPTASDSDEVADLEADLEAFDIDALGAELDSDLGAVDAGL